MDELPPSLFGRLLHEISWEGNARHYRNGGRGRENVLTAEVLHAVDLLPRRTFLGGILATVTSEAPALGFLTSEVEDVTVSVLPGGIVMKPSSFGAGAPLEVQPDAILESPSVYCLLEAKRIREAAFQPQQLAREFVAVVEGAKERNRMP